MITDAQLRTDNQVITVTANSINTIDDTTTADIARGLPLRAVAEVTTTFAAAGAATLQTQFVQADDAALSVNLEVLLDSGAIAKATLVAGYVLMDKVIPKTTRRYTGFVHTVATGPMTAGALFSGVVVDTETPQASRLVGTTALN